MTGDDTEGCGQFNYIICVFTDLLFGCCNYQVSLTKLSICPPVNLCLVKTIMNCIWTHQKYSFWCLFVIIISCRVLLDNASCHFELVNWSNAEAFRIRLCNRINYVNRTSNVNTGALNKHSESLIIFRHNVGLSIFYACEPLTVTVCPVRCTIRMPTQRPAFCTSIFSQV